MRSIVLALLMTAPWMTMCRAETGDKASPDQQKASDHRSFRAMYGERAYRDACFFIAGALNDELRSQESSAFEAYRRQAPEVAAWALEQLLKSYARNGAILKDVQDGWEAATRSHRMMAHARLFKVYKALDRDQPARAHLAQSLQLGGHGSEEALMAMLAELDRLQAEEAAVEDAAPVPRGPSSSLQP